MEPPQVLRRTQTSLLASPPPHPSFSSSDAGCSSGSWFGTLLASLFFCFHLKVEFFCQQLVEGLAGAQVEDGPQVVSLPLVEVLPEPGPCSSPWTGHLTHLSPSGYQGEEGSVF